MQKSSTCLCAHTESKGVSCLGLDTEVTNDPERALPTFEAPVSEAQRDTDRQTD